jgi:hypothetical protein
VDQDQAGLPALLAISLNAHTVPQIVVDDRWFDGFSELTGLDMDGEPDALKSR